MSEDITQQLRVILMGGADKIGSAFFNELVLSLSQVLNSQVTYIGERLGRDFSRIQTIAVCDHGRIADNFEYELNNTPCQDVIGKQICCYPSNVAVSYPNDEILKDWNIQGYIGIPLYDSQDHPLGILVSLFEQPIPNPESAKLILELFAGRISNEVERVKMQAELEAEKRRFQSLLRGVPDMIFHIDHDGVIRDFVAPDDSDLAVPNSRVIGLNIRDIDFAPNKTDEMFEAVQTCLRTHAIQTVEYELALPKGRQYFEGRFVRINGDHVSVVVRNITDQRNLEMEKNRLQARLHQAEKIQSIGQLAGGIAHDFNNQLTGIVGYAELIRMEVDGHAPLTDYIDQILTATKRAGDLTSQLLAFARKGKFVAVEIDIHQLIGEVVKLLSRSIDKRIQITTQFEAYPGFVNGDPSQLQNVLLNLGLNARDAMPQGGRLTFRTASIPKDRIESVHGAADLSSGDYVAIEIIDTGTGIESEIMDRIFEPFFTTKPEGQGTGMGLAAAYGTIKNHNGALSVRSAPGWETAFTLYLPAHSPIAGVEPAAPAEEKPSTASRRYNMLVVDDESIICTMLDRLITRMGHGVTSFTNGYDALDHFNKNWPSIDLVILDVMMPEIIGTDLFKKLRIINPKVKAILSSGHIHHEDLEKTSMEGIIAFIPKPYRIRDLQRTLEMALQA